MTSIADRRREQRLSQQTTIFVEVCSAEPGSADQARVIICSSLDISASGIQVQMDHPVPVGSILRLCADFGSQREPLYLVGETKWLSQEEELYNIGFELLDAENSDISEWQQLVDEKAADYSQP